MSNALHPENEPRPADDQRFAAAAGAPDGPPPSSGGFDVGAAAAAVVAAAAQPEAAQPEATGATAFEADAAYAYDPSAPDAVEPGTGYSIDPSTGYLIDPTTGCLVDPSTGYLIDPTTGYLFDPGTGYFVDPSTGYLLDPTTGCPLDPSTGYPFDPNATQFADPIADPNAAALADPADPDAPGSRDPGAAKPGDALAGDPGDAAAGDLTLSTLPSSPDEIAAAEAELTFAVAVETHASEADGLAPENGATVAGEPLLAAPQEAWEALPTAWEAPPEVRAPAQDSCAPASGLADDGGGTAMWDLGGSAATPADPAAPRLPDGWPGAEETTRIGDLALESSGSFADASKAAGEAAGTRSAMPELPAFDLGADAGSEPDPAPSNSPFAALDGGGARRLDLAPPAAPDAGWAEQIAVPPGDSAIDFSVFDAAPEPSAQAAATWLPSDVPARDAASAPVAVELSEPEVFEVLEEDILEVGDDVVAVDEVELVAAPQPDLPPAAAPVVADEPEPTAAPATEVALAPDLESFLALVPQPIVADEPAGAEPAPEPAAASGPEAHEVPAAVAAEAAPQRSEPSPAPLRAAFDPFADLSEAVAPTAPALEAAGAPPAAPEPEPAPAPARDPAAFVTGKHRVVVHTADGQVKRGAMMDAALDGSEVVLEAQGGGSEAIPSSRIKAIFFMLPTGEIPPPAQGRRVRVTFRDGRQVAGFSPDYDPKRVGFFMVPADTRTHTARIWVYQSAVRQVAVS